MSTVEKVARKIANSLQMQSGFVLSGQDAIIAARAAISAVREDDERKLRVAIVKWQKLNFEHRERGKKWLKGTGPHRVSLIWLAARCPITSALP